MRNGQQKRMRGRNNNRRGSNPLTRVYESNGPDVKVRGTAHHIAEKYQQLARDAQASGDPVAAENYLQHAEHYLRLIASVQGQIAPQQGFGHDDLDDDEMEDVAALDAPQPFAPQPFTPREPREQRDNRMEARGGNRDARMNGQRRNRDEEQGEGFQPRDNRDFRPARPRDEARDGMGITARAEPAVPEEDEAPVVVEAPMPRRPRRQPREEGEASSSTAMPRASRSARGAEQQEDLGLPSFITGAPAAAKDRDVAAAPEEGDEAAEGRVSRRRRRFRSRADRIEGADGEGDEASRSEGSSEAEQQPLFGE